MVIIIGPDGTVTVEYHPADPGLLLLDDLRAVNLIRQAAGLKAPGLMQATTEAVTGFLIKDMGSRYPDAGLVLFS